MPSPVTPDQLKEADLAVQNAIEVRRYHAKRTEKNDPQRRDDLDQAVRRVRAAMKPLKRAIGGFPHEPQTEQAEKKRQKIRDASASLQRERRKLWKMLNTTRED